MDKFAKLCLIHGNFTCYRRRKPESLLSPKLAEKLLKNDESGAEYADKLKSLKSKAVRHIILIRHGQYHMTGSTDFQRGLTDLGEFKCVDLYFT